MNALPILYHLLGAFRGNRQAGHTTFAQTICERGGVIICANDAQAKELRRHRPADSVSPWAVSMQNTSAMQNLEARNVPLVLDNYAVMQLCTFSIDQIQQSIEDYKILTDHYEKSQQLWAQEMQGLKTQWHQQNLEYDKKLQVLGSEVYELRTKTIPAKDIQIDAYQREILSLRIRLDAAKANYSMRHIRVTRHHKKRRR